MFSPGKSKPINKNSINTYGTFPTESQTDDITSQLINECKLILSQLDCGTVLNGTFKEKALEWMNQLTTYRLAIFGKQENYIANDEALNKKYAETMKLILSIDEYLDNKNHFYKYRKLTSKDYEGDKNKLRNKIDSAIQDLFIAFNSKLASLKTAMSAAEELFDSSYKFPDSFVNAANKTNPIDSIVALFGETSVLAWLNQNTRSQEKLAVARLKNIQADAQMQTSTKIGIARQFLIHVKNVLLVSAEQTINADTAPALLKRIYFALNNVLKHNLENNFDEEVTLHSNYAPK